MRMTKQDALGRLQRLIDRAAPASGDRLPTERRMAETLGCSRATLRAALAELESRGQIWRRVGVDAFRHVHSDQHQAIVDAIAAGDAEAARREMAGHLALVRQAIRAASSGPD